MRSLGLFVKSSAVLAMGAGMLVASPAGATTAVTMSGIVGADRYATAGQAATTAFATAATVVITSGTTFPDALSAAYLAGAVGGPILLTDPVTLSPATATAITSLGATSATIVGGTSAVGTSVQLQLTAMGLTVTRVSGPTRYDTSAAVAASQGASHVGVIGTSPTAIVASGANFPDALAAGPLSFAKALPIILTDPTTLSTQASTALGTLGIKQVLIPGGVGSVSASVESAIKAKGIATIRFSGANRFDTAAQVATYAVSQLGFTFAKPVLAYGLNFPDALAAGPFAGKALSPILLTDAVPTETETALAANAAAIHGVVGFGPAASDVPASALAAGATLTLNGTLTAQPGSALCGFPAAITVTGTVGSAVPGAPGHLAATVITTGSSGSLDVNLTTPGTPINATYVTSGATFNTFGVVALSGGTATLTGTGTVSAAGCTAPYTFQATVA